jgi:hypothetical protein
MSDFRRNVSIRNPVAIECTDVEIVQCYKYLGVNIQDNLKWDAHVDQVLKKINKRFYFIRCLCNLHVDRVLITLFYNSVISSVICYALSVWWNSCSKVLQNKLLRCRKRICKIVHCDETVHDPVIVYGDRCRSLATKIINDSSHPLHNYYSILPHGRLLIVLCRTTRFQCTFVPNSIKILNAK